MTPAQAILAVLQEREAGKTICPSEAARRLAPADWRAQMEDVRAAGRALVMEGVIEVTQKGQPVDAVTARGAIRYRLRCPRK